MTSHALADQVIVDRLALLYFAIQCINSRSCDSRSSGFAIFC